MRLKIKLIRHYIAASRNLRKACKLLVMAAIRENSIYTLKLMPYRVRLYKILFEEMIEVITSNKLSPYKFIQFEYVDQHFILNIHHIFTK